MNQVSGAGGAPHPPGCRDAAPPALDIHVERDPRWCPHYAGAHQTSTTSAVCMCQVCPWCKRGLSALAECTCMECQRCEELDKFCLDALHLWLGVPGD